MKFMHLGCVIVGMILLFAFQPIPAYGFRCGTRVISVGDSKFRVLSECGKPAYVEMWEEERILRDFYYPHYPDEENQPYREPFLVKQHVTIERWTYNLGVLKFIRYLTFENGTLVKIATGRHGY